LRRRRDELEFLPAALEIIETPASPAGRAIGGAVILFFMLAVAWATIGHVEIVATAPGEIVPSERTKMIQPLEIGVVRAIHVHDGQAVKAGQVLVELDPTANTAERNRVASDLLLARLDIARLTAMLSDATGPFVPPPGATSDQVERARMLVASQVAEHRAKLAQLDRAQQQHEANRGAVSPLASCGAVPGRGEGRRSRSRAGQGRPAHAASKTHRSGRRRGAAARGTHARRCGDAGASHHGRGAGRGSARNRSNGVEP